MTFRRPSPAVCMALAVMGLYFFLTAVSEKIPFGSGLGFDGYGYAELARNIHKLLDGSLQLSILSFNRFFPSLVCRLVLSTLDLPLSDTNIVTFFTAYNGLLLTGGAWLWADLCTREGLGRSGRWLGFIALFMSHATLKYNIFYVTLTDVTALTIGLLMLWSYLRRAELVLTGATLVGSATWPTLLPQGLILLLFPSRPLGSSPAPRRATGLTVAILGFLAWRFFARNESPPSDSVAHYWGVGIEALYLGLALFNFANARELYSLRTLCYSLSLPRLVLTAAFAVAVPLCLWKITGFRMDLLGLGEDYIFQAVRLGMKFPAEMFVAHVFYFGPWILLLVMAFPQAAAVARRAGPGFLLVAVLGLIQSLTPLSRQLTAAVPFFVYMLAAAVDGESRLDRQFLVWLATLSVVVSKVWMHFVTDPANPEASFSFPLYVSSTGCWMSFTAYWTQGLLVLGLFVLLYALWHRPAYITRLD